MVIKLLKYAIMILKLSFAYSNDKKPNVVKKFLLLFYKIMHIICMVHIFTVISMELYFHEEKSLGLVATYFLNLGICVQTSCVFVYFVYWENDVRNIINFVKDNFKTESEKGIDDLTMNEYKNTLKYISFIWIFTVWISVTLLSGYPLFGTERNLPMPAWYPFNWKRSPLYEVVYIYQIISLFAMAHTFLMADVFIWSNLVLTTGQYRILGCNFKNIIYTSMFRCGIGNDIIEQFSQSFKRTGTAESPKAIILEELSARNETQILREQHDIISIIHTKEFEVEMDKSFKDCIEHHQKLIFYCGMVESFCAPVMFIKMILQSGLLIIITFTYVTSNDASIMPVLIDFFTASGLEIFLQFYVGQSLVNECEQLCDHLYESPWTVCSKKFKQAMIIVQLQCHRPIRITAGKIFYLGLENFVKTAKTIYSFFTVLRQATASE